jgi:uncharacterized OsmC-like protein
LNESHRTSVRLNKGQALIHTDGSSFRLARRDAAGSRVGCPMQMVVGALGACIALTLDAVAKNKGIALIDFEARLDCHTDGNGHTAFQVALQLDADLSERERKILYRSAKLCEVGKLLKSDVAIDYRVCEGKRI